MPSEVIRSCVACRTRRDKSRLLRFAAPQGRLVIDPGQNTPGRGAYVCRDERCVVKAVDRHLIERGVGVKVEQLVVERLREDALRYVVSGPHDQGRP